MRYIADLHIHSCYSRATSKQSNLHGLAAWAGVKGIQVIGTGDFTHPAWFAHLSETLEEAEEGFFRIRQEHQLPNGEFLPAGLDGCAEAVRFVLTAEISSIYKRDGRVRKIHNILFAPDFASVRRINRRLASIGNLEADGRPILGLDARDLLEIVLEEAPDGFLVPAHVWTPWFSLFGSKSGFDALDECFADLSPEIFALETGLSSDPEMNRLISALDGLTLISNSDCHSPAKLGREANILDTGFDFPSLKAAIRQPADADGNLRFAATIEFYPEEGKYHCDGHRKCGVCLDPDETRRERGRCPICGKPVTIGVLHRVLELADRSEPVFADNAPAVHSLIPLPEILGELLDVGSNSKKVMGAYAELIRRFGSELALLLDASLADIHAGGSELLAEAIQRVRENRVIRQAGYDGEFGVIRVFSSEDRHRLAGQLSLFGGGGKAAPARPRRGKVSRHKPELLVKVGRKTDNPEQEAAIASAAERILVQAGPGTGKTHTLVGRVVRVVRQYGSRSTVITFTNRAAAEVRARLLQALGEGNTVMVATFHGYCLHWLRKRQPDLLVAGPEMRRTVLRRLFAGRSSAELVQLNSDVSTFLQTRQLSVTHGDVRTYFAALDQRGYIDIEAVVPCMNQLLRSDAVFAEMVAGKTGGLFIDEFQDLNRSQYDLVRFLGQTCPVFAIGDPDQAIYGFRGADPEWFHRFLEEEQPEVHTLVRNYRSGAVILAAADHVISNNALAGRRAMAAESGFAGSVFCCPQADAVAEANFLVREIEQLVGGTSHRSIEGMTGTVGTGIGFGDIGILYRTGAQVKVLSEALTRHGIPSQSVDLEPFYLHGDCRLLYLWLQLLAGFGDIGILLEVLGREQGIGEATLGTLEQVLVDRQSPHGFLKMAAGSVQGKQRKAIRAFSRLYDQAQDLACNHAVQPLLDLLISHYDLEKEADELQRFCALAGAIDTGPAGFAAYLHQFSDGILYQAGSETVSLCTLHAAKGLEFKVVFMVGLEEDLVPLAPRRTLDGDDLQQHIDEERRLFYVGMTRAIEHLYLCWAASRVVHGQRMPRSKSRFMGELPADMEGILLRSGEPPKPKAKRFRQLNLF